MLDFLIRNHCHFPYLFLAKRYEAKRYFLFQNKRKRIWTYVRIVLKKKMTLQPIDCSQKITIQLTNILIVATATLEYWKLSLILQT